MLCRTPALIDTSIVAAESGARGPPVQFDGPPVRCADLGAIGETFRRGRPLAAVHIEAVAARPIFVPAGKRAVARLVALIPCLVNSLVGSTLRCERPRAHFALLCKNHRLVRLDICRSHCPRHEGQRRDERER